MKADLVPALLVAVGSLQMIGDLAGQPAVKAIGAALQGVHRTERFRTIASGQFARRG